MITILSGKTEKELAKLNSRMVIEKQIKDWEIAVQCHKRQIDKSQYYLRIAECQLNRWTLALKIKDGKN